jgi:hypothetical protein
LLAFATQQATTTFFELAINFAGAHCGINFFADVAGSNFEQKFESSVAGTEPMRSALKQGLSSFMYDQIVGRFLNRISAR